MLCRFGDKMTSEEAWGTTRNAICLSWWLIIDYLVFKWTCINRIPLRVPHWEGQSPHKRHWSLDKESTRRKYCSCNLWKLRLRGFFVFRRQEELGSARPKWAPGFMTGNNESHLSRIKTDFSLHLDLILTVVNKTSFHDRCTWYQKDCHTWTSKKIKGTGFTPLNF